MFLKFFIDKVRLACYVYFKGGENMDTIGERIKRVRMHFNQTQADFGEKIKLSQNYVWMIEQGKRNPSDRTISDICREFGVNEIWLRHGGDEPMFKERTRKEEISAYMGKLLGGQRTELEEELIKFMAETDVSQWKLLLEIIRPLAEKITDIEKPPDT